MNDLRISMAATLQSLLHALSERSSGWAKAVGRYRVRLVADQKPEEKK